MKIVSKATANNVLTNSLNVTLRRMKFDTAKYKWHGSQDQYIGREVPDLPCVHAVYVERRTDADGPYAQLLCVTEG